MKTANYILGEFGSMFELYLTIEFITDCLEWKEEIKQRKVLKCVLFILLFMIAQGNGRFSNSQIIVVAIDLVLFMLYAACFLKERFQYRLLICILPFLIVSAINVMIVEMLSLIQAQAVGKLIIEMNFLFMIGFFASKVLFYLALKHIKFILKNSFRYLQTSQIIVISVLIIYTVVMEFCILYIVSKEDIVGTPVVLSVVISWGIIFLSIYMIYSIFNTARQNEELIRMNILKVENQEVGRQLRELKKSEQRIRKLEHDYKNHCLNMNELLKREQYQEVEHYLEKITDYYLVSEKIYIETQNSILDAVLNVKIFQAREKQMDMVCYVVGDLSEIDGMEMGSILFNLLDNAIEATRQNKKVEKKIICNINKEEGATEIFIKNSIDQSVLWKNSDLRTSKANKALHGIGQQIVRNLVEKMEGMIDFYEEDKMFCVHIYLPE